MEKVTCPVWQKTLLTLEEAAAYFGVGTSKLRDLTDQKNMAKYVCWNGKKRLIKRKAFDEYLQAAYSI